MTLATTEAITLAAKGPGEEAHGPFIGSHPTRFQPGVQSVLNRNEQRFGPVESTVSVQGAGAGLQCHLTNEGS